MSSSEWANRTSKAHSLLKERRSRRILTEEAVAQSSPSSLTNKVKGLSLGSEPLSPVRIQHRSSPVTHSPSQEETRGAVASDLPSSPQPDQHPEDQRQRASQDESFSNERCASPTRIQQESPPPLQSPSRVDSPERKKVLPRSPYRSRIHKSKNLASPSRIHQEPVTSKVPPSPPRQESQKELPGSPSSPDRYNQCQDTSVQSPLPKSIGMGPERQLVMLISVGVCDRQQATHQDRSLTILKGKGTPFTTVDGMDPSLKEVRNELFALSGIRGNYPQFFFAHPDGSTTYFGGWEKIEEINENSSLPPEILYNNPKIETWDSFFGGVVDRFSSD